MTPQIYTKKRAGGGFRPKKNARFPDFLGKALGFFGIIWAKCLTFCVICVIIVKKEFGTTELYGGFAFMDDGDGNTCQYTVTIE